MQEINLRFKKNTLKDVLEYWSKQDLFEYYLTKPIVFGNTIKSPLREDDSSPSFVIFKDKKTGEPLFTDHGTGISGDVFTFLQIKKGLSFSAVVDMLVAEFINNTNSPPDVSLKCVARYDNDDSETKTYLVPEKQNFTKNDIAYWQGTGICTSTLVKYDVMSCKTITMVKGGESKIIKTYNKRNPIFAYQFGQKSYKIYSPLGDPKYKWLNCATSEDIQGFNQLEWTGDLLILTKSLKDVMFLSELGYNAIALQSESTKLSRIKYEHLSKRFKTLISFYDNDQTGIDGAYKLYDEYGMLSLCIPLSTKTKDITDYYKKYGRQASKSLMETLVTDVLSYSNPNKWTKGLHNELN